MFELEEPYGLKKRLDFASVLLKRSVPKKVLEIGCGTGALLLHPLAKRFPECNFLGIDSDQQSIDYANKMFVSHNLTFTTSANVSSPLGYDVVIASEVLEHVDSPLEFLAFVCSRLAPGGYLLLTIPNGYGAFEIASMLQIILDRCELLNRMLYWKRKLIRDNKQHNMDEINPILAPMSLAFSPHVNFFSFKEILRLLVAAGLTIESMQNRTFLCGFLFDLLISRLGLSEWNARIADRLPPSLVADWMFVLRQTSNAPGENDYYPGRWARFRRRLNRTSGLGL